MSELLEQFADVEFISWIVDFAPFVAVGILLGVIFALIGWVWGFVIRVARIEV